MEEEPNNQAPSTWLCTCSQVNQQTRMECEMCGLKNPIIEDQKQPQGQSMEVEQPQPEPEPQPQTQAQAQEQPPSEPEARSTQNEAQPQEEAQEIARFRNVYENGPVQILATVPGKGDLVPKKAIRKVIKNFDKEADLIIIANLGVVGQGKSTYANILTYLLLNSGNFTPFEIGAVLSTTKGLNLFSNPLHLADDPKTQIMNIDVEGAHGLTKEPPEAQALGLKRLYTLGMLLSSVVIVHLGVRPAQSEITLLKEASETVLYIQSKLLLDLPKIYLLIKDAEDNAQYQEDIKKIREILENQLNPEIMRNIEILPRGKLSENFLESNPPDYSQVNGTYLNQMRRIVDDLRNHVKNNPLLPSQRLKISAFPDILEKLGVGVLNDPNYLPYLERSIDFLRSQELSNSCQRHLNAYTQESKQLAENPQNLTLTAEQFAQQLKSIQDKHKANFLQEAETIGRRKVGESPLLQSFQSQLDISMQIGSFEQVFLQNKSAQEQQQAEKEKQQKRQQDLIRQEEAAKQQKARFEQERQNIAEQRQEEMNRSNQAHIKLIQEHQAQHAQQIAQAEERNRQQQQQNQAEINQAEADRQQSKEQNEKQQAEVNQKIAEEQNKSEEQKAQQQIEVEEAKQKGEQEAQEKQAQIDQELAEAEKQEEEQQQKQQEEAQRQQEQQAQEQAQLQQQMQQEAQDDDGDDSGGDCCNIF